MRSEDKQLQRYCFNLSSGSGQTPLEEHVIKQKLCNVPAKKEKKNNHTCTGSAGIFPEAEEITSLMVCEGTDNATVLCTCLKAMTGS